MDVLSAIKGLLERYPPLMTMIVGGVHINQITPQAALRPNVLLQLMGGSDEWSHQGPTGLMQQTVRLYSRGDTDQQAGELARAIRRYLNGNGGMVHDMIIHQIRHTNATSDYHETAKVQRNIDSYVVTWGYHEGA